MTTVKVELMMVGKEQHRVRVPTKHCDSQLLSLPHAVGDDATDAASHSASGKNTSLLKSLPDKYMPIANIF